MLDLLGFSVRDGRHGLLAAILVAGIALLGGMALSGTALAEDDVTTPGDPLPDEAAAGLSLVSVEATFLPDTPIELAGELIAVDGATRVARFSADSGGVLEAEIEAVLPGALDAATLRTGFQYSVTLRRASGGVLRVAGLSPAWGERQANDPALAFGEHG